MEQVTEHKIGRDTGSAPLGAAGEALRERLGRLHRRVQRLLWVRSAALMVLAILAVLGAGAVFDWWWRPTAGWSRGVLTSVIGLGVVAAIAGVWWRVVRHPPTVMSVARRFDSIVPGMGDRLSSVLALCDQAAKNPRLSGGELAEAAARQVQAQFDAAEPESSIDRGPATRMVSLAGVAIALTIAGYFWNPGIAALSARRIFSPAASAEWPRQNHLEMAELPERIAKGASLSVFVHDTSGTLPDDIEILLRREDRTVESLALSNVGEWAEAEVSAAKSDFEVRARGGDDDTMPWYRIKVLDAPELVSFTIRATLPDYAGGTKVAVPDFRAKFLAGTTLDLSAKLSMPVAACALRLHYFDPPEGVLPQQDIRVVLSDDSTSITVEPFVPQVSCMAELVWEDRNGMSGESQPQWQWDIEPDTAPSIEWIVPEDDQIVTSEAEIELAAEYHDNFGLVEVWFEGRLVRTGESFVLERASLSGDDLSLVRRWSGRVDAMASDVSALEAGDVIELVAVARDTSEQRGESTIRRLRIVDTAEMQSRVGTARSEAIEQLRQALEQQRVANEQAEAAASRLQGDDEDRRAAEDRLRAALSSQRAAQRHLSGGSESALERLEAAARMAKQNRIPSADIESLLDEVARLAQEGGERSVEQLQSAVEQLNDRRDEELAAEFPRLLENQRSTIEQLAEILEERRKIDAAREAAEKLGELTAAQQRLMERTRTMDGAADRQAEAERLAARQRQLARDAEALRDRLEELARNLETEDSEGADNARRAARALREGAEANQSRGVAEAMRAASEELERGRSGSAEAWQREAMEQVEQARRDFAGERPGMPGEATEKQEDGGLQSRLEKVRLGQMEIVEDWVTNAPEQLAECQSQLRARTVDLGRETGLAPGFAETFGDAASDMNVAEQYLRRGEASAVGLGAAKAALSRLELALDALSSANQNQAAESPAGGGETEEPQDEEQNEQMGPPLESLKLARATQAFLKQRTVELSQAMREAEAAGADAGTLNRYRAAQRALAEEQRRLVERIEKYANEVAQ